MPGEPGQVERERSEDAAGDHLVEGLVGDSFDDGAEQLEVAVRVDGPLPLGERQRTASCCHRVGSSIRTLSVVAVLATSTVPASPTVVPAAIPASDDPDPLTRTTSISTSEPWLAGGTVGVANQASTGSSRAGTVLCHGVPAIESRSMLSVSSFGATPALSPSSSSPIPFGNET